VAAAQGFCGGIELKVHDVADFLHKLRAGGKLEGVDQMRCELRAHQMRLTADWLMLVDLAMDRADQWVASVSGAVASG
jgi:hypothetical protein